MSSNAEPQDLPLVEFSNEKFSIDLMLNSRLSVEEDIPFGCKNTWLIGGDTAHYCPLCDKLEYCADDLVDYDKGIFPCNFSTVYGFHPECYFKKPFLSTDGKQFYGDMTLASFDLMMDKLNRE